MLSESERAADRCGRRRWRRRLLLQRRRARVGSPAVRNLPVETARTEGSALRQKEEGGEGGEGGKGPAEAKGGATEPGSCGGSGANGETGKRRYWG